MATELLAAASSSAATRHSISATKKSLTQNALPRISLLGIPVDNVTMSAAVNAIVDALEDGNSEGHEGSCANGSAPKQVSFVNADCVNVSFKRSDYRDALVESDMIFADGIGVRIAGDVLGTKIVDNVNGTDMFPLLAAALQKTGKRIYLLGGKPGVAAGVAAWLTEQFDGIAIAGYRDGYFSADEEDHVLEEIRMAKADLILVAFGAPRQELWIRRCLPQLGVRVAIGVGGLFDFYSGRVARAPHWIRKAGLEWAFRMYQEPGRLWKRYMLGNALFLGRLAYVKLARVTWA